jgi:hypothetical protein
MDYMLSKEKIAELEKVHCSLHDKHQTDQVKTVIALAKTERTVFLPSMSNPIYLPWERQ